MLVVRTFGGLAIERDGAVREGAAARRKTLALLALLAAAGTKGLSRDKLIGYLWPETDTLGARHLLKQTCYALRHDLGEPDLFLGRDELRLNPAVVSSDIQAFEAALESGDQERAAALYTGPFLDGFYLSGAGEFERWVDGERARLAQRACAALEALAGEAAARGNHARAGELWRRLATLDPLSARVAVGLMSALDAAGDRAGALQFARVHEAWLREEFDTAPDRSVVELVERLLEASDQRLPIPAAPTRDGRMDLPPMPSGGHVGASVPGARVRVAAALALVVGGFLTGGWLLFRPRLAAGNAEAARRSKRVVVLPFANLGRPEDAYFADGITDEITARLAAIDRLRVIAGTNARADKEAKKTAREIGRELGADYVLEGSVRWEKATRGRARVRITPQLVSALDETRLWAEVYDEPLDEIFEVQSDVARKVVSALDVTLLEPERRVVDAKPTGNLRAYDYYLRGKEYMHRGTEERVTRTALRMYEKAVELDPGFALAYAELSQVHSRMYWFYYDRSADGRTKAKRAADKAFELAPGLPEGHRALGFYFLGTMEYDRALREFDAAAAIRPGDMTIYLLRATVQNRRGNLQGGLAEFERALQLDPRSPIVMDSYAQTYDRLRDFARAETVYSRAIDLSPDWFHPYFWKAGMYLRRDGTTLRARAVLEEAQAVGIADDPLIVFDRVLVDVFDRRYDAALGELSRGNPEVIQDQFRFIPRAQLCAQLYGLTQRHDLERSYYDSARSFVSKKVQERPDDPRLHSALGIAYAGLGRRREAIQEGQTAVELMPVGKEAYRGYYRAWDLARIYAMLGERDSAVAILEHLLSIPGHLTVPWLRIDPTWDPLRSHPRFQKLLSVR